MEKTLEQLIEGIPPYAKDLKLNLKSVLDETKSNLSKKQIIGTALASAITTKNKDLILALENEAKSILNEVELNAAKGAAAIMGMNNIYYRFLHLAGNKEYANMNAGLRMQIIANHQIEKLDFELYSLAVSAINGCGMCIDSHEKVLISHGVDPKKIQDAIKIAAVINGTATALSAA